MRRGSILDHLIRLCRNFFLLRDEFSQNRYHMLYIRCRCDLSQWLFPKNEPAFSPSRESDPDHNSEIHALELRDHILRIIAFVSTSSDPSIRSPSKCEVSFIGPDRIYPCEQREGKADISVVNPLGLGLRSYPWCTLCFESEDSFFSKSSANRRFRTSETMDMNDLGICVASMSWITFNPGD